MTLEGIAIPPSVAMRASPSSRLWGRSHCLEHSGNRAISTGVIRVGMFCLAFVIPCSAGQNPRLEYALGVLEECRGEERQAAVHFENARLADPHATALVERGVSHLLVYGDRPRAIALYRDFAAARPDDVDVQLAYADFLVEQGKGDALATKLATDTLRASLAKSPGNPGIIRRLFSLDRLAAAGLLDNLSPEDPQSALLFAALSRTLHEEIDAAALAEIDRRLLLALDAHPADPVLAREVSDHFRNTKRIDAAIDALKRHTTAAPWSLDARVRLGVLNFSAKRDAEGETALKDVLAIHPGQALAHQALAKFYRLRGEPQPAAHHAAELLKIRGGSPIEFLKLADERLNSGDARGARLLLEKAVFDHPDHLEVRMKLAIATHRDPETRAQAPRLFRQAEAGEGEVSDPLFLTASAEALIESGQSKAGEERLRAAIRTYPAGAKKETAAALRRLATLWESENRNAEAARALRQRADSLNPK